MTTLTELIQLASTGNVKAQFNVALFYDISKFKDENKAIYYYQHASGSIFLNIIK
jgi:TPR repeat protein